MVVLLIGKTKVYKTYLPSEVAGNYWITDTTGKKLLNIEASGGKWQITSNNHAKVVNPNYIKVEKEQMVVAPGEGTIIKNIIIEENNMYAVCLGNSKTVYALYCSSETENKLTHMDIINTQKISIGTSNNNDIIYRNFFVSEKHAEIIKDNGKWIIKNYNIPYGTLVNNMPIYDDKKVLTNGDIIFIMGLRIMLIRDSIYVNNPQNNVTINNNYLRPSKIKNEELKEVDDIDDSEIEIIKNDNFYNRAPRMINLIKKEEIKIDEPPTKPEGQQKPTLLLLGSSLAMGVIAILSLSTAIQGIVSGTATIGSTIMSAMYSLVMIVAMIVIPLLNIKYDKKIKERQERKRQKKYKAYLEKKQDLIDKIRNDQKDKLYKNNLTAEECENIVLTNNHKLWERKIDEEDFLTVRLGIGDVPLNIEIKYPEERFSLEDDNLLEMIKELVENSKNIKEAPITVSLLENKVIAIIEKNINLVIDLFMKNIILQLITLQSYEDLNLVFLVKDVKRWEYVKMIPHVWDATKQIRFFADNYYDMNEISKFLEEELKKRKEDKGDKKRNLVKPHYLIITDDYQQIENLNAIIEILKLEEDYGFTLLCITDDLFKLPNECKMFISIDQYRGTLFENKNSIESQKDFVLDDFYDIQYEKVVQKLANIPIKIKGSERTSMLPSNYSFLEMFEVGNIESLNILDRWKSNDSTMSLRTPIGIDANERIISLDIHEKYHGPHGLVAGSTGSGKSEFIITYILSLAINYHPDDVAFLLIDYKGGGLAGAFENNEYRLPHLVGKITNIDTNGLQRSLISIQSELKKRQRLFNEVRNLTNEGTIDIYKYQRLYHEGEVKQPIPHLLIICDEFAELKQQQEDFMDELISVSRIGRSLGVHLILATQKPAGIVNDQIRSNSKFAVCLKVQDRADSQDVIKKTDAAFLKNTGQFYLQVGNDEYFVLGQSAWAGAKYIPSDTIQKKVDTSVEFISNIGEPIKRVDDVPKKALNSQGEQLTNIVKYISELANKDTIKKENNLWLENIPQDIYVKELRQKYNVVPVEGKIEAVIGEYDDPANQKQDLVKIDLLNKENINVYGNAESGKETLIITMIYDLMTNYSSEEVQFYILDFGSEVLKIFKNSPHVGDVIFIREEEKISRFFDMIQKEMKSRRDILSNYNGDYNLYLSKGNVMPEIVVVINNYEVFQENYETKYEDTFSAITRDCTKYGITFVTTVSTVMTMRYRLSQNFNKKLVLQMNNEDEYINIFNKARRKKPANIFGRGLVTIDSDEVLEFQTARISGHKDFNDTINKAIEELKLTNVTKAKPIPIIPEVLTLQDVAEELKDISTVPIGMKNTNLGIYTYDFKENFTTLIVARNMKDAIDFAYNVIEEIKILKDVEIQLLDAEEIRKSKKTTLKDEFEKVKTQITKKNNKFTLCVIIGINKFITEGAIDEIELNDIMTEAEKKENISFVIIDNPALLKNNEYSQWYKNYISKDSGIWVGNGITEQYLISNNLSTFGKKVDYNTSFGYAIEEREATLIKLLGMKDKGD